MKVQKPERGAICQSLQGRDKGCLYVVCEVQGEYLLLADGERRKLENPKKKNLKHVRLLPENIADEGISFPWNKAFDNRIAHLLKVLGADKS